MSCGTEVTQLFRGGVHPRVIEVRGRIGEPPRLAPTRGPLVGSRLPRRPASASTPYTVPGGGGGAHLSAPRSPRGGRRLAGSERRPPAPAAVTAAAHITGAALLPAMDRAS
ncbi:hypothetical protein E2C01_029660 [Portunus trituberculatus]|uniref:Uncharacterized protein n=1 Tax=Portunus trituberculatus TaxID=210409 RepID=A0A5B7ENY1_PORTR|nr:hypothetical protein [Portunus trituberculatus]